MTRGIQLAAFAGGHRGVVTPVPIPNTEVKGSFAEGSAGLARARVGRTPLATATRLAALGGYSGFFLSLNLERLAIPRPTWAKHPILQVFFFCDAAKSAMGTEDFERPSFALFAEKF